MKKWWNEILDDLLSGEFKDLKIDKKIEIKWIKNYPLFVPDCVVKIYGELAGLSMQVNWGYRMKSIVPPIEIPRNKYYIFRK